MYCHYPFNIVVYVNVVSMFKPKFIEKFKVCIEKPT